MTRKVLLIVFVAFLIGVVSVSEPRFVTAQTPETRVAQSWERAVVYLPRTSRPVSVDQIKTDKAFPVAIFMHGCGGITPNSDNYEWAKLLASEGLLVVMPDSLARYDRQPSCDPKTNRAGLFPPVHGMRLEEIKYASEQIRSQPWFDGKTLFLMGFSEGAVAAVRTKLSGFRGVIASSWTCTNNKAQAFDGIYLPLETPLLTLAHEEDPWYQGEQFRGTCAQKMSGRTDSHHVVVPGREHGTYDSKVAREAVVQFVRRLLSSP
jgi:dienelactone hydrolase